MHRTTAVSIDRQGRTEKVLSQCGVTDSIIEFEPATCSGCEDRYLKITVSSDDPDEEPQVVYIPMANAVLMLHHVDQMMDDIIDDMDDE